MIVAVAVTVTALGHALDAQLGIDGGVLSELHLRLPRDVLHARERNVSVYLPGGSATSRYSP